MRKIRVLSVDDDEEWRDLVVTSLSSDLFKVRAVENLSEVREQLSNGFYHYLILDIRLNDRDKSNVEGMNFLRELADHGQTDPMKVVMLSGFGTSEQMREALVELGVIDFINKGKFDYQKFSEGLGNVIRDQVNLNLDILWQGGLDLSKQMLGIKVANERLNVKTSSPEHLERMQEELEDLICRLFLDAERVILEPLTRGRSGAGILLARPHYGNRGAGEPLIVKYGDVDEILDEARRHGRFVKHFLGGSRYTAIETVRRTALLGGICYSLLGTNDDHFDSWHGFFDTADDDQIRQVLDELFTKTCASWYSNADKPEPCNLTEEYRELLSFTRENLTEARQKKLTGVKGQHKVQFRSLEGNRLFRDPIPVVDRGFIFNTCRCVNHGDLSPTNLLIDRNQMPWLIDFQRTGKGYFLRDLVQLDAATRIFLLLPEDATLDERLEMEEALSKARRCSEVEELDEKFATDNEKVAKVFATAAHLRKLAAKQIRRYAGDDFEEFHAASMFVSLNCIRNFTLPILQREHAFLSAAINAEELGL